MLIYFIFSLLRDRLIQLLALKPFKKPEIYARINSGMCIFLNCYSFAHATNRYLHKHFSNL